MTTPALLSRHGARRSLRAGATMVVLRIRPPRRRTRSWNHRLSAEVGWFCSHSQASSTIVVLSCGLLVAEDPLGEEQPFDPVDVRHPLAHQRPALAADTPAVLLLRRRRPSHRTHPRLTTLVGHQRAHQGLAIDPVGLLPA